MEACPTFKLAPAKDRPAFVSRQVPQRVLDYYFLDKELGRLHVRLQTWAPFTCQVYANRFLNECREQSFWKVGCLFYPFQSGGRSPR